MKYAKSEYLCFMILWLFHKDYCKYLNLMSYNYTWAGTTKLHDWCACYEIGSAAESGCIETIRFIAIMIINTFYKILSTCMSSTVLSFCVTVAS